MDFGWRMAQNTMQDDSNQIISPVSAMYALGTIAICANGETLTQIEDALGVTAEVNPALDFKVPNANAVWTKEELKTAYRKEIEQLFDAEVFDSLDQNQINGWVREKTNGMIPSMVEKIDPDTKLIVMNALAFDEAWRDPVEEDQVQDGTFTNADGTESTVSMLYTEESQYVETEAFEGFLRPYEDARYCFALLLPKEKEQDASLSALVADTDPDELYEAISAGTSATVHAVFPEFTMEREEDLNDTLKSMGMRTGNTWPHSEPRS